MAATESTADVDAPAALAAALEEPGVRHVLAHADGDALAAGGLLVRAAAAADRPYQLSVLPSVAALEDRLADATEETTTIAIGHDVPAADASVAQRPAAAAVARVLIERGEALDAALTLAGIVAADGAPEGELLARAQQEGIERRPGVAIADDDPAPGLARSTLVHGPFSGDPEAASALLETAGTTTAVATADGSHEGPRRLGSLLAIDATDEAPPRAATAVGRALRPHVLPSGPFPTVEGYADVIECLAQSDPGLAAALAADHADARAAADAYGEAAAAVHEAVSTAEPARYRGVVRLESGGPPGPTARLYRDYRAAEPTVLVVGADRVALATSEPDARARLTDAGDRQAAGHERLATVPTDGDVETICERLRGST